MASDENAREVRFGFDGASLALSDVYDGSSTRSAHGELWAVSAVLALDGVRAEARVWLSDLDTPLNAFFRDMADNWRGWEGAKEWGTYEGGLRLSCSSDGWGTSPFRLISTSGLARMAGLSTVTCLLKQANSSSLLLTSPASSSHGRHEASGG